MNIAISSGRFIRPSNNSENRNAPRLSFRCMRAMQPATVKLSRRISRLASRSDSSKALAR